MFSFIKKVLIVLLSLNNSLATCMIRPTFIDLNPVVLKYRQFMISVDK